MKTIVFLLTSFICTICAKAQENNNPTGTSITVTISNAKNNKGTMLLGLHSSETFMKGKGIQNISSEIKDNEVQVTFKNVPKGEYAILVLHDENNNNRMDFESTGMPKEDYGMSNNPMSYGPPQFYDAKFNVVDKNLELEIRL